ncbi:acetyl-CoA carboxylase carboxyltransferase subunit alpha [Oceanibacterium hippocampi]|uniref:Acetyl-coenzyme A carboxylase carboxyl transferase subunit alpha n=1 Tax=Oceanibacterium hippocampi TaxID=745714 RepID=A0A1Y5S4Y9_9PROT|nr:acetyl-CoA carboxylase carboxyltransferase subunit alpha [Oceanibacterium hippocampi]SLN32709.1 Acetyl-coenzyme A carboxylase carboxyl transferase subunit alpha [Oceanibacterium hippocampi]
MDHFLEFEKPIAELEGKIGELSRLIEAGDDNLERELERLRARADQLIRQTYAKLDPWQKTQVARHTGRPKFAEYADRLITDFTPLAGDRGFADDKAIIGGPGRFRGRAVMVIGTEKGSGTDGRLEHNFGMARPEGYRKAQRLMDMADRFNLPVLTFIDTMGAYPGIGAEERGQAQAIARTIEVSLGLGVPVIAAVVGEGGSGGAVALATANRVLIFEHAIYSVISPEGCASILWQTNDKARDAAIALKLTAQDLEKLKVVDAVVKEPVGGAHRDPETAIDALGDAIDAALKPLLAMDAAALRQDRRQKFLELGRKGL